MIYGYARVSSADQNLSRQIEEFKNFGISKNRIYCDKKSGKDFIRDNYLKLIKKIKKGDLLVIKSIDRLGRNYLMITNEWRRITVDIGADILVLDMPLLDTRVENSLIKKFIADVVLQVLSFVAENERVNIKERQKEGIRIAKERGVKFGRPQKVLTKNQVDAISCYNKKSISLKSAISLFGGNASSFYYFLRKYRKGVIFIKSKNH